MGEGSFSPTFGDAKQFHFQMPEGQRGRGCKINQQPLRAPIHHPSSNSHLFNTKKTSEVLKTSEVFRLNDSFLYSPLSPRI